MLEGLNTVVRNAPPDVRGSPILRAAAVEMHELLAESIAHESVSGNEGSFTRFIADWARNEGFSIDLWQSTEADLAQYALARARHIPLAGRPTLVIHHPGNAGGRSLLFNAHADVVAAPGADRWKFGPFAGTESDGSFYGRGACDTKGPMVAALWAMLALKRLHPDGLAGDVALELIPGEEDCVGLGTLTSLVRGHRADGLIVLEPTENIPRCASRGGCRFEITCTGQAVHGTVKWLGVDAIQSLRLVLDSLARLEARWNDRNADPLFSSYPIARPMTVDSVHGGQWQGMICDHCTCAGYLELLPGDDLIALQERFRGDLLAILREKGQDTYKIAVEFTEAYSGHRVNPDDLFCTTAAQTLDIPEWTAFNSGCEAGLRASLQKTPTLVWGPGSLAQAHAVDEFVQWRDVETGASLMMDFAMRWCSRDRGVSFGGVV